MIIVQFSGGLGNQLAQYGLYSEYRARGLKAYADLSWYGNAQPKDGKVDTRKLELPHLGINLQMCPEKYACSGHEDDYHRYLRRIMVGPVYFEKDYKFTPELLNVKRGYVMGGCFLGEDYMPFSEGVVRESINFRGTDSEYIQQMEEKITSCINGFSNPCGFGKHTAVQRLACNLCEPVTRYRQPVTSHEIFIQRRTIKTADGR